MVLVNNLQLHSPISTFTHPYGAVIERHIRHLCNVHSVKKVFPQCFVCACFPLVTVTKWNFKVAIRRDVLYNLSHVSQVLLERSHSLIPEDGIRGIYRALTLLCKTYAHPHSYLVRSHGITPLPAPAFLTGMHY